ncbi:hypothetical protein [uncultured Campylobacter sp.]|uniref:hypothetical protein n=1 Tax=uncultured Campylobacter sp. TaxID=218934 RepID=UPI00262CFEED|nr:hypothetical protein [uncultured Campylobacter sp.]
MDISIKNTQLKNGSFRPNKDPFKIVLPNLKDFLIVISPLFFIEIIYFKLSICRDIYNYQPTIKKDIKEILWLRNL